MKIFVSLLLLLLTPGAVRADWKDFSSGLEYRTSPDGGSHFFRIDPKKFRMDLLLASDFGNTTMTAEAFRRKSRALLVINGGFFDALNHSLGLLHRQSRTINPVRNVAWGIFFLGGKDGREASMIHRSEWRPENAVMAIQSGPRLLVNGEPQHFKETGPSRRSALGITPDGRVEIAISEGFLTLGEWAQGLREDCLQALNLDGGGSSQLSVGLPEPSLQIVGLTGVPNAVGVFRP